jgi:hypothetical protein
MERITTRYPDVFNFVLIAYRRKYDIKYPITRIIPCLYVYFPQFIIKHSQFAPMGADALIMGAERWALREDKEEIPLEQANICSAGVPADL